MRNLAGHSIPMKFTRYIQLLFVVLVSVLTGCSTVEPGKRYGNIPLESLKSAYIVLAPSTDHKLAEYIHEALEAHQVTSSMGPPDKIPADVSFFVTYEDHWRWDMAMYLNSLDVRFCDITNRQTFATGAFRQGAFHSFPNPRKKTVEVVESIYKAK